MFRIALLSLAVVCCLASFVGAGQGPQNVAVVINARSPFSLAVGHHYARLRNIPTANILYLEWDGSPVSTDVETFRQQILLPIARLLEERRIAGHVTTIAYSSDFPYVIDYKADLKEDTKVDPTARQFHQGSLTGLTYLGPLVLTKDVTAYTNLGSNFYYRPSLAGKLLQSSRDFPPGVGWNQQGEVTEGRGMRYMLSTMLAYTSGRGNSLAEVEHYLGNCLRADGTYPSGKIYYLTSNDVRARTREPHFKSAVSLLERLGIAAEVVDGVLPRERSDIMGAMIGTVDYRFAESGSQVRGGAICENLTSFGGILRENGGQTALSECLRAGAAGSSGTVTEPYAIQAKFPHPLLHVHYAQGCCLAEAFYQAVQGPYQLLIVGDPLCRPWATIPHLSIAGLPKPGELCRGQLTLTPTARTVTGKQVGRYELYVDGELQSRCNADASFSVDTTKWADGAHELRIVGYEDSLIATQGEVTARVATSNHRLTKVELQLSPARAVEYDRAFEVSASAPGASELALYYLRRPMGSVSGEIGSWKLPAAQLGLGDGAFQVVAKYGPAATERNLSEPLSFAVLPPAILAASAAPVSTKPGIKVAREGHDPLVVERLADDWLQKAGIEAGESLRLNSYFKVPSDDLYQLQVDFAGELEIFVDGQSLGSLKHAKLMWGYLPVSLAAGYHRLEIRGKVDAERRLNVSFGNCGTQVVTQTLFYCVE